MFCMEDFYYLEEKYAFKLRQESKEKYWSMPEMTSEDYKKDVSDLPITFDAFQAGTDWTVSRNPVSVETDIYLALGLAGECGELVDEVKKKYRDDGNSDCPHRKEKIAEEAGDVLYYLAALLDQYGISLEEVAKQSQTKSVIRFKERFMK